MTMETVLRAACCVPRSSRVAGWAERAAVALALVVLAAAPIEAEPVVAVLPLSNVGGSAEAAGPIESAIRERLSQRGWTVASAGTVEKFLEENRIRYLDSLSPAQLAAVRGEVGASAVLVGSILAYRENGNPVVALAARMLDADGTVVWGEVVAASAAETEGVLGFGRRAKAESLAKDVATRLLERVPRPGEARLPSLNAGLFARGAATYRGPHPKGKVLRVCVLPFASAVPEASRVLLEILTVRLEATGEFDVVEPAEFRDAMRAAGLPSIAAMTSLELAALGQRLQTTVFLRGNVHTWREATGGRSEVQFDMTLVDVTTGEILWAVTHQRRGGDYSGVFQRGTVDNVVSLADRALSEAIAAQQRARPKRPGGPRPARETRKER
jgi:TolB-like protein